MRSISASVKRTRIAPRFSSSRSTRLVPGIGITSGPCANSQARQSCAGVQPFSWGDCFDALHQLAVLGEIVAHEPGVTAARVTLGQISEIGDVAGQEAAAERGVGDKGDAEVARELAGLGRLLPIKE